MVDMAIWAAYDDDYTNSKDRTVDAVDDLINQIESRTSHTATRLGVIGIQSDYLYKDRSDVDANDEQTFRNAADYIEEETGSGTYIENHDHLLVGRSEALEGWGDGPYNYTMSDGDTVFGGNQFIAGGGYYPARNIGMHELLHPKPIFATHSDGAVNLDASFQIDEVSPMCTSYTYNDDGSKCDTEICGGSTLIKSCGSGTTPDSLCSRSNYAFTFDTDCPIHVKRLSDCTLNRVKNNLGGFADR